MTDSEINKAISKIEWDDEFLEIDYCNNWEDIGPIIEREKIELEFDTSRWIARGYVGDKWFQNCDSLLPTKAAALCYLMMKDDRYALAISTEGE